MSKITDARDTGASSETGELVKSQPVGRVGKDIDLARQYHLAQHHKSPEGLRKFALIQTGHCDAMTTVCMFKTEALRLASLIRRLDEYAVVVVDGKIVTRYTAKSQSLQAMGKAAFQQSKDDVLGFVSSLIGVAPADLARAA